MKTKTLFLACVSAGLGLYGCGDPKPMLDPDPPPGDDTGGAPLPGGSADSSDPAEEEDEAETDGNDDDGGQGFIPIDDMGGLGPIECDVWAQDCPDGEKCMPWDSTGGSSWNATRCTPLTPNPAQPGDECTVDGSGVSGLDDCDLASMCWQVDPETNTGTCISFCHGSQESNSCDDPSTKCSIFNGGVLILCLPTCDPLAQDCGPGEGCYASADGFVCIPDASGPEGGSYGDPCEYVNVCDPGLFCAAAAAVPNCQGSSGCCSEYCDLSEPDPTASCTGAAGGQECLPWYEEGQSPPGYEDVGACAIPA